MATRHTGTRWNFRLGGGLSFLLALVPAALAQATAPQAPENPRDSPQQRYPAASRAPWSQSGWVALTRMVEKAAPPDEAGPGARTARGTPLHPRNKMCFPTETRNLFSEVDQLPTGVDGKLQPIDYLTDGKVSGQARDAIRGQNTWMLWGQGNEAFWGWLQENGYGLADFLILLDSRKRGERFKNAGIINQPGMTAQKESSKKILGLYIDQADGDAVKLKQPPTDIDAGSGKLATRVEPPPSHHKTFFNIGDVELYNDTILKLPDDGIDPAVYGYPSGVVGLRLMLNPDFFGDTKEAARAREYWRKRVIEPEGDPFYDPKTGVNADPQLVRPFRVSMACAYCHIGPHPLNPPADPEAPQWSNLSSIIGGQYWLPPANFTSIKDSMGTGEKQGKDTAGNPPNKPTRKQESFLWQFVNSQQPGTIDTSLVSTDHINNANTINAVFEIGARLDRALRNPAEMQSKQNMQLPAVEDAAGTNPRHTPRVLVDGADSIGVFGALARVYLNIGAYSEQWQHLHNPVIGFKPQRPFAVPTIQEKSVFWQASEEFRIKQLAAFFTHKDKNGAHVTQAMKLEAAQQEGEKPVKGRDILAAEKPLAAAGREVFINHCAVCHSSKQPDGFGLAFSRNWNLPVPPDGGNGHRLVVPMDFKDWEAFKSGKAYKAYLENLKAFIRKESEAGNDFLKDNYLSTDIRVPVTLVGTNSGRAVATNAMRGQVWDNFSSEDYKNLPAVGPVRFYNPYLKYEDKARAGVDEWGHNDAYAPPGGGPGYYRPASLVSLWATAPLLHNNALGKYNHDPSIQGRLAAFDDAIDKLLSQDKRRAGNPGQQGDLRREIKSLQAEPGFIYRTTSRSWIDFPAPFIRPLLVGVLGEGWTSFLGWQLWLVLGGVALVLAFMGRARPAGFLLALVGVLVAAGLRITGVDRIYPALWLIPALSVPAALWLWIRPQHRLAARAVFGVAAAAFIAVAGLGHAFVNGKLSDLAVGPIPKGTPVNLLMNINPQAPTGDLVAAVSGMARGFLRIGKEQLSDDDGSALEAFEQEAGAALLKASKCPDFVLDRGHLFGEKLSEQEKQQLKAFLKTL